MITPLDIENKKFAKQMVNGYNVNEVDDFLDELTVAYEKLYKENAELKSNTEELHNDVGQYKNLETTLQNTLVMAQKTADEIQDVARRIIDFVAGASAALDGHMQKISNAIFLVAPVNYDIASDLAREELKNKVSVSWLKNN